MVTACYRRVRAPLVGLAVRQAPRVRRRHLIPDLAIQHPAAGLRLRAAPLLEEEGDTVLDTLLMERLHPGQPVGAGLVVGIDQEAIRALVEVLAALTADDHPVDATQVEIVQWTEQRLSAD